MNNSPIAECNSGSILLLMFNFLSEGRAKSPSGALVRPFDERSISVISDRDSKDDGMLDGLLCVSLSCNDFKEVNDGNCRI